MPKTQQAIRNKQSRDEGKLFESHIETACEYYRIKGIAEIEKTPEPRRVIGRTGDRKSKMVCVNEKKAQPDFKGTLLGGKSIVFEAKHTDTDRMKQDVVTHEQAERLDRHYKLGASCWVVVSYKFRTYARIPWDVWRKMKGRYGRKYITEQEAEEYKIPLIDGIVAFLD
jgi:recombination protein U